MTRGLLICFEGLDRSGKSTQTRLLHQHMMTQNQKVELIHFPNRSTTIGQMINSYLQSELKIDDKAIHLLFSANRWEQQQEINDKLEQGVNIIMDRYAYSGAAFTHSKGIDLKYCQYSDQGLSKPDLVFFMDVDADQISKREGFGDELYENQSFQHKVYHSFIKLKQDNWIILDAEQSIEQIQQQVQLQIQSIDKQQKIHKLWDDI